MEEREKRIKRGDRRVTIRRRIDVEKVIGRGTGTGVKRNRNESEEILRRGGKRRG